MEWRYTIFCASDDFGTPVLIETEKKKVKPRIMLNTGMIKTWKILIQQELFLTLFFTNKFLKQIGNYAVCL